MTTAPLDALARSLTGPFAFCGIAVAHGDRRHLAVSHVPEVSADAQSLFRMASVSKVVVGQPDARRQIDPRGRGVLIRAQGAFVKTKATTWDSDISDLLGWSLRHADYPDRVVTLGMVASHSAGLSDDAGYLIPPDQTVQDWCRSQPVFAAEPGTRFSVFKLSIF